MRLYVGIIGTKERLGALDGERFHDINMLATAVVALARITLGVLVGQATALRFHHARTGVILGSDQLDVRFLALRLAMNGGCQLIIEARDGHIFTKHGEKLR